LNPIGDITLELILVNMVHPQSTGKIGAAFKSLLEIRFKTHSSAMNCAKPAAGEKIEGIKAIHW